MDYASRTVKVGAGRAAEPKGAAARGASAIVDRSPRGRQMADLAQMMRNGPAAVAQRTALRGAFGAAAQLADEGPVAAPLEQAEVLQDSGLPPQLKAGVESLSGVSMDGVRVHYNSSKPAQLNALAYAQGSDIHLGPGQEQHLPHEAWHVVQQAQGRVRPDVQMKGGAALNTDAALEHEADVMGARAASFDPMTREPRSVAERPAMAGDGPIQAKLGFEIEMLVLVDDNGRPVPEKVELGAYGTHCKLVVDHGPSVEGDTPATAESANYDLGVYEAMERWWWWPGTDTEEGAYFDNKEDGETAHPGELEPCYWDGATMHAQSGAPLDWSPKWRHQGSGALYATEGQAQIAHPPPEVIERVYVQASTGTEKTDHPHAPEMGKGKYASIIEIVTNAYEPETDAGRDDILQSIKDARTLANDIEAAGPATSRFKLKTVAPAVDNRYHAGNAGQPAQTTDGSFQATGGLDLAQFASYVLSMTGNDPDHTVPEERVPLNDRFNLKHHSDTDQTEGDRVWSVLPLAVTHATTAVNAIKGLGSPSMANLRGLVVLICQYLEMGLHFFGHGGNPLGKNIVPFLSRTDLSQVYQNLVPATGIAATDEKAWLAGTPMGAGETRLETLIQRILTETGRAGASLLFNDNTQANVNAYGPSCRTFLDNVFTGANDGVIAVLGNFTQVGTEIVDPSGARDTDSRRQGMGAPAHREGFVFEMRNMAKRASESSGRFPRSEWYKLAEQQVAVFRTLNARTEAQATQDQRVRHAGFGMVEGGAHRLDVDTTTDNAW